MTALTGHVFHGQGRRGLGCPRDEWPGDSPAADAASQPSASRARTRRAAGQGGGTAGLRVRRLRVTQRVVSTVWDSIRAPRPASRAGSRTPRGPDGAGTRQGSRALLRQRLPRAPCFHGPGLCRTEGPGLGSRNAPGTRAPMCAPHVALCRRLHLVLFKNSLLSRV